jgi:hypothetical protein
MVTSIIFSRLWSLHTKFAAGWGYAGDDGIPLSAVQSDFIKTMRVLFGKQAHAGISV